MTVSTHCRPSMVGGGWWGRGRGAFLSSQCAGGDSCSCQEKTGGGGQRGRAFRPARGQGSRHLATSDVVIGVEIPYPKYIFYLPLSISVKL